MTTTYTYDIEDFLNDEVNSNKLTVEIEDSSITKTLEGITTSGDDVYIDFDSALTTGEETTLEGIVAIHDGQPLPNPIEDFLDENALVTINTPSGSFVGEFHIMQTLVNRREIFNDDENPLYDSTLTPILGSAGYLEDHADRIAILETGRTIDSIRILNLETIHGKLGWHNQDILTKTYEKPDNLLIYYGWINSFNSGVNGWNNEKVAQDMAKYNIIVLGDGVQAPTHGDYSNTQVVIARIKALNPSTKIFGYVTTNQSLANFKTKTDQWETLQVHGIFFDESGYDYGSVATNGRAAFNVKVDYVHDNTYANLCFINAWNIDHIIGTENDVSYPNTTYNAGPSASNLDEDDFYLLESFAVNTLAYTGDYEAKADWLVRGEKATGHREEYGINLVASCVIQDGHANDQDLLDFAFTSAMIFNLEGFGSSDHYYGASSAKTEFLTRPDVSGIGEVYTLYPVVKVDVGDSDVYHRYTQFGKLSLDFSSGSEDSNIEKY